MQAQCTRNTVHLKELTSILFTNLKVGPTREGTVCDVNRGAIFEEKMCSLAPYTMSGYLIGMMPTYRTMVTEQTTRSVWLLCGGSTQITQQGESHAVPTQDSEAWRKLTTCPQS